jgi:hypothetical protein
VLDSIACGLSEGKLGIAAGLTISIGLILAREEDRWRAVLLLVALIAVPLAAVSDWTENGGVARGSR